MTTEENKADGECKYDPFGRRIQKAGPLGTTNYLYDGMNLLEEIGDSGNVLAQYSNARGLDEQLSEVRSGTTSYYEADGLGTITSLSNSAAAIINSYSYESFGKLSASSGTLANPLQYAGREYDEEMGVYFNRARYYDSRIGRFLTEDPTGFDGGTNFYAYVDDNPTDTIDPFGLQAMKYQCTFLGVCYRRPSGYKPKPGPNPIIPAISNDYDQYLKCKDKNATQALLLSWLLGYFSAP